MLSSTRRRALAKVWLCMIIGISLLPMNIWAQYGQVGDIVDLKLKSLDGMGDGEVKNSEKVIVLHIWASWCGHCRRAHFLWKNYLTKIDGAEYYGVTFREGADQAKEFLMEYGDPYDRHVYLDSDNAKKIKARTVPDTLIMYQGKVLYRKTGSMSVSTFQDVMLMQLSKTIEQQERK